MRIQLVMFSACNGGQHGATVQQLVGGGTESHNLQVYTVTQGYSDRNIQVHKVIQRYTVIKYTKSKLSYKQTKFETLF